jgi:hypothetical protein
VRALVDRGLVAAAIADTLNISDRRARERRSDPGYVSERLLPPAQRYDPRHD